MPRINHNGYVEIHIPAHHRARANGYVFEHIIVLENKLGRKLEKNEQAHHINGIKTDNRPENLEAVDISEHAKITAKERRAKNIIECIGCGVEIYRKPSEKTGSNYCNRSCKAKNQARKKRGRF